MGEKTVKLSLLVLDSLGILLALYTAAFVRELLNPWFLEQIRFKIQVHELLPPVVPLLAVWAAISAQVGLYSGPNRRSSVAVFTLVFKAVTGTFAGLVAVIFFMKTTEFSRSLMILAWAFGIMTVFSVHMMARHLLLWLKGKGVARRVAVIGTGLFAARVAQRLDRVDGQCCIGYVLRNAEDFPVSPFGPEIQNAVSVLDEDLSVLGIKGLAELDRSLSWKVGVGSAFEKQGMVNAAVGCEVDAVPEGDSPAVSALTSIHHSGDAVAVHAEPHGEFLGRLGSLRQIINENDLQRVVCCDPRVALDETVTAANVCTRMGVEFQKVSELAALAEGEARACTIDDIPMVSIRRIAFPRRVEIIKRVMDLTLVCAGALVLAPAIGLIALAIKLDSRGPVFFRQKRMGKGGRYFTMLKFRSMYAGSEEKKSILESMNEVGGALFKMKNDPRITRVGKLLRRTSLDELPQIFNVLIGNMSLIGPRPLPVQDIEGHRNGSPDVEMWASLRENVLPGISGLWQVGGRSESGFEQMVLLDTSYVQNWSLAMDLGIIARTFRVVLRGRGAY